MKNTPVSAALSHRPLSSFQEFAKLWAKIGVLSFGGPAAQIALMQHEIIDKKGWLTEKQYLSALSFCMLLPGPEAMQLAVYVGWRLRGALGGLVAGLLFVLPGAAVVLVLAMLYTAFSEVLFFSAFFLGVKATIIVIVIQALLRISKRTLHLTEHWLLALLAFVGIFFLALPYPLIIAGAGIFGFMRVSAAQSTEKQASSPNRSILRTLLTAVMWLVIWWTPLLAISLITEDGLLLEIGVFFSKLAVVTFGGAYAVLTYMGQAAVNQFGWLSAGEMIDGLGLAETTPGPLILVTEFVGFIAAHREGGLWYGVMGALVTLWVTFVPCFLWIFASAPYIDWITAQPRLNSALSSITATVVGIILNLAIWFALHVFFAEILVKRHGPFILWQPQFSSLNWHAVLLTFLCGILLFKLRWSLLKVLLSSSIMSIILVLAF